MPRQDLISADFYCPTIECLPAEHSTEGAIVRQANDFDNLVHGPPVEVFVGDNRQGYLVCLLILLDSLKGVVPVPCDALINRQKLQIEPVVVPLVESGHDVDQHCRVFSTTSTHRDSFSPLKELIRHDSVMNLLLEDRVEAFEADWHAILRSLDSCLLRVAQFALASHLSSLFVICVCGFDRVYISD